MGTEFMQVEAIGCCYMAVLEVLHLSSGVSILLYIRIRLEIYRNQQKLVKISSDFPPCYSMYIFSPITIWSWQSCVMSSFVLL